MFRRRPFASGSPFGGHGSCGSVVRAVIGAVVDVVVVAAAEAREVEGAAAGRRKWLPGGLGVGGGVVGEADLVAAVGVHRVDLGVAVAGGVESDLGAVW